MVSEGRAPRGARGLKFSAQSGKSSGSARRAPHGARGLKFLINALILLGLLVAPRMGRVD